jgi:hypothetical protein
LEWLVQARFDRRLNADEVFEYGALCRLEAQLLAARRNRQEASADLRV